MHKYKGDDDSGAAEKGAVAPVKEINGGLSPLKL